MDDDHNWHISIKWVWINLNLCFAVDWSHSRRRRIFVAANKQGASELRLVRSAVSVDWCVSWEVVVRPSPQMAGQKVLFVGKQGERKLCTRKLSQFASDANRGRFEMKYGVKMSFCRIIEPMNGIVVLMDKRKSLILCSQAGRPVCLFSSMVVVWCSWNKWKRSGSKDAPDGYLVGVPDCCCWWTWRKRTLSGCVTVGRWLVWKYRYNKSKFPVNHVK